LIIALLMIGARLITPGRELKTKQGHWRTTFFDIYIKPNVNGSVALRNRSSVSEVRDTSEMRFEATP